MQRELQIWDSPSKPCHEPPIPEAFLTWNWDASCSRCAAAWGQVSGSPSSPWSASLQPHSFPERTEVSASVNFPPLWLLQSSSPADVLLSHPAQTCLSDLRCFGLRQEEEKGNQALQYSPGRRELKPLLLLPLLWVSWACFLPLKSRKSSTSPQMNDLKVMHF